MLLSEIWPSGTFTQPQPIINGRVGCFSPSRDGSVCQTNEDVPNLNAVSSPLHLSIVGSVVGTRDFDFTCIRYCSYTSSSGSVQWPSGSYCIARQGATCPSGFSDGSVYWDDQDHSNFNSVSGVAPSGEYGCETLIYFCCRSDGPITTPIVLPTARPFYLWRQSAAGCQQVQNMNVTLEWVVTDDENDINENAISGTAPYVEGTKDYNISYCYYERSN